MEKLLSEFSAGVQELAQAARVLMREALPGTSEETDEKAKLIAFTYQPGTYKGLVAAIALHKERINIMFSKGAQLDSDLLEGTGKLARHIKVSNVEQLTDPRVRSLLIAASKLN